MKYCAGLRKDGCSDSHTINIKEECCNGYRRVKMIKSGYTTFLHQVTCALLCHDVSRGLDNHGPNPQRVRPQMVFSPMLWSSRLEFHFSNGLMTRNQREVHHCSGQMGVHHCSGINFNFENVKNFLFKKILQDTQPLYILPKSV